MPNYFQDEAFQNKMTAHTVRDKDFLKAAGRLLSPDDFKPVDRKSSEQWAKWVVSSLALNFWTKHRQPIGILLRSDVLRYVQQNHASDKQQQALLEYVTKISKTSLIASSSLTEKILDFKKERARFEAIEKVIQLQNSGELTDELALQTFRDGLASIENTLGPGPTDFLAPNALEDRIGRRSLAQNLRNPLLFIDPLDFKVKMIGRKELGLWLGPYKSAKSLALIHTALAYTLQRLKVLFITCEDPKETVEDRFDSMMTQLPVQDLPTDVNTLRTRYANMYRMLTGRLFVIDATEGQCTLNFIEEQLQILREQGVIIDALIVDYDDEIVPPHHYKERRMEFGDIYRGLRRLLSKWSLYGWTAAQTQRGTQELLIIGGDKAAEDISKLRKVTVCLGIGNATRLTGLKGAKYLYVAAHKNDRAQIGTFMMSDIPNGLFYHRAMTRKLLDVIRSVKGKSSVKKAVQAAMGRVPVPPPPTP